MFNFTHDDWYGGERRRITGLFPDWRRKQMEDLYKHYEEWGRNPEWEELPFTDEEYIRDYLSKRELSIKNFKDGLRLDVPYVTYSVTPPEILKYIYETLMELYKDCYVLVPRSYKPDEKDIPWRRYGRNSFTWCVPVKDWKKDKGRRIVDDNEIEFFTTRRDALNSLFKGCERKRK